MRAILRTSLLIVLTAGAGAACATARAAAPIERPPLEVPPPPPRVISPLPPPQASAIEPVGELAPAPGTSAPARPRPQRNDTKPEARPEAPPPTEPATQPQQPPPAQPPQLRIPETSNPGQAAVQIKEIIDRTNAILANTHYDPLSDQRKKAYNDAKLFAKQAEDALKASNLVFAKELAEKAERLAKELQGR